MLGAATWRYRRSIGAGARLLLTLPLLLLIAACSSEPPEPAGVRVTTTPEPGAIIKVGETVYGESPTIVTGLPPGEAYIIAEKAGFRRTYGVQKVPETGFVELNIDMQPLIGYLSVKTDPPGAPVFLEDGTRVGITPLEREPVPVGKYSYQVMLPDYEPLTQDLTVEGDFPYTFSHVLKPKPAELQIVSDPSGSQIWLNDELQEEVTPAKFAMKPGTVNVGVYTEGYVMKEEVVTLEPNKSAKVVAQLERGYVPPGMILIPAGEFIMGKDNESPDERPQRKVHLPAYYIDKYEVTNKEFAEVFPAHEYDPVLATWPVSGVSWKQATEYAAAIGKRLPTEEEWEKAARGEKGIEYPWGNVFNPEAANCEAGPNARPKQIGSYREHPSPYGCLDMAGNVYEWTSSWYRAYPGNPDVEKEYGQVYRVLRGGSYLSDRYAVRAAKRYFDVEDAKRADYGFRCAMDVEPDEGSTPARASVRRQGTTGR